MSDILAERRSETHWVRTRRCDPPEDGMWTYATEGWDFDKGEWTMLDRYAFAHDSTALKWHTRVEAKFFPVDIALLKRGWPDGNGLAIRSYGMVETGDGSRTLADGTPYLATSHDISIAEDDDPTHLLWEADELTHDDHAELMARLEVVFPEAEWEDL